MLLFSITTFASKYIGTITFSKGDVKVLEKTKSSKSLKKQLQIDGEKFYYHKSKIGLRVKAGRVIQSGPKGKAKIVYANGDHFIIGPGSSIKLPDDVSKTKKDPTIDVFYGKVRSLISKKGPRNTMKVKTKTAVAGVRGTDFYVHHDPAGDFNLHVLRGKVEVKKRNSKKIHVIPVGKSIKHRNKKKHKAVVYITPKKELRKIAEASHAKIEQPSKLPNHVRENIEKLEGKAFEAVLDDIKIEDKELYDEIKMSNTKDVHQLHSKVINGLHSKAPGIDPKEKRKMNEEEIDKLGNDTYKNY